MDMSDPKCTPQDRLTAVKRSGKRRVLDEDNWQANRRKRLRNSGDKYVSKRLKVVAAKTFVAVQDCCKKECYLKVEVSEQEASHEHFYVDISDYDNQNYHLSGWMQRKSTNSTEIQWSYFFRSQGSNVPVCQKFLCSLLQIKRGRLTTIQNELVKNLSLKDCRSKHDNHKLKMNESMKDMIEGHCETHDHSGSHYTDSSLKYSLDPALDINKLYKSFCEYYCKKTQTSEIPISLTNYGNFFNHELKFAFSQPRTDVCNTCYEFEIAKSSSPEFEAHKNNVEEHRNCKKAMIPEKDVLCLEFDFGQNLPVPNLPVNDQFYKRLFWLHVFNVNVLKDETRSYTYFFMEGSMKKGANTVCNFLLDAIFREFKLDCHNKILLFCDSCGGQNKNNLVLYFLSLLAETLQLEIHQLFPVKGHSYCSCDRNFGVYGNKKKHLERIETAEEYYRLVEEARDPPFTVLRDSDVKVVDFESVINEKCNIPKNLGIRDAVKISYFPNGEVHIFDDYDSHPNFEVIDHEITLNDLQRAVPASPIGIAEEKIKDVRSLLRFLSPENRLALEKFVKKPKNNSTKNRVKEDCVTPKVEARKKQTSQKLQSKTTDELKENDVTLEVKTRKKLTKRKLKSKSVLSPENE